MRRLIVDSGSKVSILQPAVSRRDLRDSSLNPFGVTGKTLDVKGRQLVSFKLGGQKYEHMFLVCPLPTEAGTDFLKRTGAEISFKYGKMGLTAIGEAPSADRVSQIKRAALTVFSEDRAGRSPRPTGQEELHLYEQLSDVPRFESTTECSRSRLVWTTENITVAPRSCQVDMERLDLKKGQSLPSLVCVEPTLIPIQGVLPARVLT